MLTLEIPQLALFIVIFHQMTSDQPLQQTDQHLSSASVFLPSKQDSHPSTWQTHCVPSCVPGTLLAAGSSEMIKT